MSVTQSWDRVTAPATLEDSSPLASPEATGANDPAPLSLMFPEVQSLAEKTKNAVEGSSGYVMA